MICKGNYVWKKHLVDWSRPIICRETDRLVIFSFVQLTPRSPISSSSNWTSSVFDGEVNRSILRFSTSQEKLHSRAKHKSQSTCTLQMHTKSNKHGSLLCRSTSQICLCSQSSEQRVCVCIYVYIILWPAYTHRHHGESQNCIFKRKILMYAFITKLSILQYKDAAQQLQSCPSYEQGLMGTQLWGR